ncbi:bifunctional (p)ppGpp synthetase/guanosine-3',5'-bis(diphosphate) 3'-pyrophosphohydrolase [Candidatus Woesearchaeota archaeon]|nr:bifunctional (p)ppGpp synthetase/guanosine-3',5'-bis(diphosphate) 3'-pyrophosphohydrolase [Candidatus Woesearchaeota archaeon]
MRLDKFIEDILEYNPKANIKLIRKAYILAEDAHKGQTRFTGEPYFSHPVAVAEVLIKLKADSATICAALLHDIVEDTPVKIESVKQVFGEEIALLVDGVTKLDKIHFKSKEDYNAENLRKILIATGKDIRVMLIKLADRMHNMQTLKSLSPEKQERIAQETLEIYAPIAHKLGMWRVKGELEDLSLRYLKPEIYQYIKTKIAEKRGEREAQTKQLIKEIKEQLKKKNISARISGRAKYFFSIYKKMEKKKLNFDEINDLIAMRIITKTIPECYAALGIVHELWKPAPGRFKDYISVPKANGYQSLHTTVITGGGKRLEIQIRTEEMHHMAEDGVAAHWQYHGTERDKQFDKKISWLKQLLEWRAESTDAKQFIESLKIDLFEDEIVVFTPKGDPISLPVNSTPVDFAYMVHTSIGENCSKSLVNNKIAPLETVLHSGDVVEIITQKNAKPSRQWLKFVKTNKAKSKIRQALHMEVEHDPKAGRRKLEKLKESVPENLINYLEVVGMKSDQAKLSKCCNPQLSDRIVGFLTKDKKVTVHKQGCSNIHSLGQTKEIPVLWNKSSRTETTILRLLLEHKVGTLAKVLTCFVEKKVNISNINTKPSKDKVLTSITIETADKHIISELIKNLKTIPEVANVEEIKGFR